MTIAAAKASRCILCGWDVSRALFAELTAVENHGMEPMALRAREARGTGAPRRSEKGIGVDIGWTDGDMGQGAGVSLQESDGTSSALLRDRMVSGAPELRPGAENPGAAFSGARHPMFRRFRSPQLFAVDIKANRIFFGYRGLRLTEQIVLNDGHGSRDVDGRCRTRATISLFARSCRHGPGGFIRHLRARQPRGALRPRHLPENGVIFETGPHKHAIQQTFSLVYEPGGTALKSSNAGAGLSCADWEADRVDRRGGKKGQAWGTENDRVRSYPWHAAGGA